jgi:uncharacterized protein (DUF305 family)
MRAALVLTALALTACDGGGDPVEQALRETAAINQSAATRTTAEIETPRAAAPSRVADEAYVAGMIARHRAEIALAETALRDSRDPEIRRLAQDAIEARTREIAELRTWSPADATGPTP